MKKGEIKKNKYFLLKGFTLAELMIVISIVSVISTVVMFGYRQFSDRLALTSAAQEIAISIREAQSYGVSVRQSSVSSQDFDKAYGIYFSMDDPSYYYIFVDLNDDQKYENPSSCTGECVSKTEIRNNVHISLVCGGAFGGSVSCPLNPSVRALNVSFIRPNPDARVRFTNSGGSFFGNSYKTGRVELTSPLGNTMRVDVENTGQIYIN
ncbi:MAG: prepilin-type N-terminal cleavage/methylation domain-containing protein [Candidatus Paceibacterota bacterium]